MNAGVYVVVAKRIAHVEAYLRPLIKLRDTARSKLIREICEAAGG
jgi:hypothetical protein